MSDDSDEEVFDYEEICYNKSIDKCSICNKVLIPDCGPYEDENDHENEIVVACDNNHRFHRGCIRGVTGSVSKNNDSLLNNHCNWRAWYNPFRS